MSMMASVRSCIPVSTDGSAVHPGAREAELDISQLVQTVGELFKEGLAPATGKVYTRKGQVQAVLQLTDGLGID